MGKGDMMDDFKDEEALVRFIHLLSGYPGKKLLIFNGDTFDFLKMDYQGEYTRYITEQISLWKLDQVLSAHQKIFLALREFIQKGNSIHFVIGNHDFDLEWPALQQKLKETLGSDERVQFSHYFQNKEIHIEHGNSTDTFYSFNTQKPFIIYRGQKILNLPFGSYAVTHYLINLKKHFPAEEQLYPRPLALKVYPKYRKESLKQLIKFSIKGLLFDPLFKFYNPTFRIPYRKLIRHLFHHGLNITDDEKFVQKHFELLTKKYPGKKAFILGHRHTSLHTVQNGYSCLMTDTWRHEFKITLPKDKKNLSDFKKTLKQKTYIQASYQDGKFEKVELKIFK